MKYRLLFVFLFLGFTLAFAKEPKDLSYAFNERVEHIVVLMLENRAFDHMLGYLHQINPKIDGLTGNETCLYDPLDPKQGSVQVSNTSGYITSVDPNHSLPATSEQIFGFTSETNDAIMDGFVYDYYKNGDTSAKGANIMKMFSHSTLPSLTSLALEYGVFDRWYSSIPGPTQPNRLFFHSATSDGATLDDVEQLAIGYPQKTIYDSLYESNISWYDYFGDFPSLLFLENCRSPDYVDNYADLSQFYIDAQSGSLPYFSFLEPRWFDFLEYGASDQHPPHDVKLGEYLIADIYESLRSGPKWNNTLFIITYDEHGGFYDHVPTPLKGIPSPDGITPPDGQPYFTFDRLGIRVPTVMVSPWINKGTVVSEPTEQGVNKHYDHTSVAATLKKVMNLTDFLTKRDAWAPTFEQVVTGRDSPRSDCPLSVPVPGDLSKYQDFKKKSRQSKDEIMKLRESMKQKASMSSPISELQTGILAIARGLDDDIDRDFISKNPNWLKEIGVNSEEDGSLYVQGQIEKWMSKMKAMKM
eukprot:TRINITY_DN7737_c0_g1_i1.p1 TRINITY_DN7737_c0_g1~~TRINITY_DN7737_c0_g1_i1.p1  ORF type:complete len:527 (-),score=110.70 TRINITY_DN7737_c0_g1_i1:35-1615(-)